MPADAGANLKIALAEAAGRTGSTGAAPQLMALLKSDASQQVRLAALEALRLSKGGSPDELMQIAFADTSPAVRRAAIAILPTLPLSAAAKTQQLATLFGKRIDGRRSRASSRCSARSSRRSRARRCRATSTQLNAGTLPAELQVDLLDAVQTDGSEALAKGARDLPHGEEGRHAGAGLRRGAQQGRRLPRRPAGGHRQPGGRVHPLPHHPRPRQRRRAGADAHRLDPDPRRSSSRRCWRRTPASRPATASCRSR